MSGRDSEALGYITWWGLSPAINLLPSDYYLDDTGLPAEELGIQEVYGNTLFRESTESWLDSIATQFIEVVTDTGIFDKVHPHVSINKLKSKDRDRLECVFKSWRKKNLPKFEISTYWDSRVRQHLGVRYDAIPNIFDWDCSIVLRDRGIKTIDNREYSRWRSTGIAFTPRQASYLSPNRSLASPRYFSHRYCSGDLGGTTLIGYWGDIVCSPYLAFGTCTDRSPELARTLPGGRVVYGASVLSEVNLRCLLWEATHGRKAPPSIASVQFGMEREDDTPDARTEAEKESADGCVEEDVNLCQRFEVEFYSTNTTFVDLSTRLRSKFIGETDRASVIYVGCSSLVLLEKASNHLLDVCTHDCRLIIESVLYIVGMKEAAIRGYVQRAGEIATSLGFKPERTFDAMTDHHLYFVRDSETSSAGTVG